MQIIAGTPSPSYGRVCVRGKVAALFELGSGFNPDFTGKENVVINGKILGLTESEIKSKFRSIQDFAEIGNFFLSTSEHIFQRYGIETRLCSSSPY